MKGTGTCIARNCAVNIKQFHSGILTYTFSLIIALQKGDCRVYHQSSMLGIGWRDVYVEI